MTVTGPLWPRLVDIFSDHALSSIAEREGQSYDDLPDETWHASHARPQDDASPTVRYTGSTGTTGPDTAPQRMAQPRHAPSTTRSRGSSGPRASSTTAGQPADNPRPPAVAGPSSKRLPLSGGRAFSIAAQSSGGRRSHARERNTPHHAPTTHVTTHASRELQENPTTAPHTNPTLPDRYPQI